MYSIITTTPTCGANLIVHKKFPSNIRHRIGFAHTPPLFTYIDRAGTFHIDTRLMVAEVYPYSEILDLHALRCDQETTEESCKQSSSSTVMISATTNVGRSSQVTVSSGTTSRTISIPDPFMRIDSMYEDSVIDELANIQRSAREGKLS